MRVTSSAPAFVVFFSWLRCFPVVPIFLVSQDVSFVESLQTNLSRAELLTMFLGTAENQWLHLPLITKLKKDCKEIFPVAEYAYTTIPTYPSGQIGFMVCCKDDVNVKVPLRSWTPEEEVKLCRYYNSEIHKAAFVLPTFAQQALK
jgi:spermidine synthase